MLKPNDPTKLNLILLPQMSGLGYYSYSPADRQYGTKETIQTIVDVGKSWALNTKLVFGVGDLSFKEGGAIQPHGSHKTGLNVDIRPVRLDKKPSPCNYTLTHYDKDMTKLLITAFLAHRNVARVLFNDRTISGTRPWKDHDNHFHVVMHK